MAVTYDRVDLSQINFDLLRHDYTDGSYPGYPVVADWGNDPRAHVAAQVKSSLFKTMIASGLNQMNLFDTNSNVIGEITIQNYKVEYVTYERVGAFGDEQTSTSGYPEYRDQGHGGDWGVKYIRITRGDDPDFAYDIVTTVTINGVTENRHWGSWGAIEVADYYGTLDSGWAQTIVCGNDSPTLTLMSKTTAGVTHQYLEWCHLRNIAYTTPAIDYGFYYVDRDTDLLADNLDFAEHIVQEDGYVNELDNRFSPRTHSIMTGMYVAYADTIGGVDDFQMSEIASALMTFDIGDLVRKTLLGSDGKEFIISINWFYGIRAGLAAKNMILGPSDFRVGGMWPKAGLTPGHVVHLHNVGTEYFLWETPELYVGHKFGDYRDFLANYKIFLPYYGFVDIDPNDAVDAYIKIYYNINMLSRAADIVISTRSSRTNNQNVKIMSLSTTVGVEIPFGADACKSMMLAVAQTAGKAITTAASVYLGARGGQIGAAIASNSAANAYDTSMMNASIMSGNNVVDLNAASKGVTDKLSENAALRNQAAGIKAAQNAIPDMPNTALPSTTRSNGSGSENGSLDELHPYMLIEWPVTCEPNDWEDYVGIPASASTYLTANLGFTQVGAVHPDSMANAPKYIDEIIAQLKVGVYL